MSLKSIEAYFPSLTANQLDHFKQLESLYNDWNNKINVISRKDIGELYTRHILHSLGIAKIQAFNKGAEILDIGTGGGLPGIPLAILFPETQFVLIDAIGKKIKVVKEITEALQLKNITAQHIRAENIKQSFDFIVSRAVTNMPDFVKLVKGKTKKKSTHELRNGILYLKGGDLKEELSVYRTAKVYELKEYFKEDFFETKKVVHLPLKYTR